MSEATGQTLSSAEAYDTGRRLQSAGDLDAAKRYYGHVLFNIPHHSQALTMLASIAYQQGDDILAEAYVDRALGIYEEVLERMPNNLSVRAPLVNLLLARDRRDEAERHIAKLKLPLNPIRSTPEEFVRRRQRGIAKGLPPILINALPKSASESIWNRLAEGLDLPQSHLTLGLFPECSLIPARAASASDGGLVSKEHLPATPHNLDLLERHGLTRQVFHVRDPRQATLSWAHFVHDDVSMRLMGPIWRKTVPPATILSADLATQIDWCIENYLPIAVKFIGDWMEVAQSSSRDIAVRFLTFERFREDAEGYLTEVLAFYGIDPGHFEDPPAADAIHLRKGLVDEWRDVLSAEQQAWAWRMIPPDMAETFGWQE